jgi:hypothetical protein
MARPRKHRKVGLEEEREAPRASPPLARAERPVRKNHYLYQSKIDMAREILGATSETETLDRALDLLIYGEALARGTEEMAGDSYEDVLGIAEEVPDEQHVD